MKYGVLFRCQAVSDDCRLPTIIIPGILLPLLRVKNDSIGEGRMCRSSAQSVRRYKFSSLLYRISRLSVVIRFVLGVLAAG